MCGYLCLIITDQSHVEEIFFSPQETERLRDGGLEVVPLQTKLFRSHLDQRVSLWRLTDSQMTQLSVKGEGRNDSGMLDLDFQYKRSRLISISLLLIVCARLSPSFTPHYNYNSTLLTAVLLNCTITFIPRQYVSFFPGKWRLKRAWIHFAESHVKRILQEI